MISPRRSGKRGTLDDLKEKVKKELLLEKERERDNALKEEILEKVLEANPFEPPASMVEEELEHMMESTRRSLCCPAVRASKILT